MNEEREAEKEEEQVVLDKYHNLPLYGPGVDTAERLKKEFEQEEKVGGLLDKWSKRRKRRNNA